VPVSTVQDIASSRSLNIDGEANADARAQASFRLAKADVLWWLAKAPNVSQAGISYTFTDKDRLNLKHQALAIYDDCGEESPEGSFTFGYKGEYL